MKLDLAIAMVTEDMDYVEHHLRAMGVPPHPASRIVLAAASRALAAAPHLTRLIEAIKTLDDNTGEGSDEWWDLLEAAFMIRDALEET